MHQRFGRTGMTRWAFLAAVAVAAALVASLSLLLPSANNTVVANSTEGPHLTVAKTVELADGEFTFTFVVTNDGSVALNRDRVYDNHLGDIRWEFPARLEAGETVVVVLTKQQWPGDPLCDIVELSYYSDDRITVHARADACVEEEPEPGSIKLTKFKEIGEFTTPLEVCFRLDPVGEEKCAEFNGGDTVMITWTDVAPGNYTIVETLERCAVNGVVQFPCTAYFFPLPDIDVTMPDPAEDIVLPAPGEAFENVLQPGGLCVDKLNEDRSPWTGGAVTFEVTGVTDTEFPPRSLAVPPTPACTERTLVEGTYQVCVVDEPAGFVVEPECQTVDVLGGGLPPDATVTFINTPTDGEGCTPGFWRNARNGRTFWDEATEVIPTLIGNTLGVGIVTVIDVLPEHVAAIDLASDFYVVFDLLPGTAGLPVPFTTDDAIRKGGGGANKLARHGMAAILNAAGVAYPLSITDVQTAVHDALVSGNYEPLATQLNDFNNAGCTVNDS